MKQKVDDEAESARYMGYQERMISFAIILRLILSKQNV
jgi:hypothetical protein